MNAELAEQARSAAAAADLARREEEQRAEEEFVNAERIRLDQVKRERESDRIRIEAEDAEEQRQLMLAISAEKSRREEDRLRLLETARLEREREAEEELIRQREREVQQERETVVDDASSEMARKAEVQRLKREAFLKDMNAFSQTIEEEAERAASGRRAAEERSSGQYARSTVPISTSVNPFDESPPQFNYETETPDYRNYYRRIANAVFLLWALCKQSRCNIKKQNQPGYSRQRWQPQCHYHVQ